jgi:ribonucleoside-triphosphate reductase (formate)
MDTDIETKRQKCDVFSRVVGFVRRVDAWNYGKQAEYKDRKLFEVNEPK